MSKLKTLRFFTKHKQFTLFLILAFVILGIAIFAPLIATKDPYLAVMSDSLMPPGGKYIFGTDKLGRDVFSRIIYGTRTSLTMTLCVVLVIFIVGTTLGVLAGFLGGVIDEIIMRFSDMMISFPGLVLAIAIAGLLGPSMVNAIIAITAVSWTKYARLARSLVIKIKSSQYIEAAYVIGTKKRNIITRYILPNILSTMIVTAATDIATMMLELAALSFLGFGAQAPTPEWGLMLNEGRTYLVKAPWLMIYPGVAIMIVVVVFNMLGDSIRDIWDPKDNVRN